jgi:uncharacterized protein YfaS (alpha-2-macroglobulin family)
MSVRCIAAVVVGALLLPLAARATPPAARVTRFSPQDVAKQVQQVAATFSEPMVAFGDPGRSLAPFRIDCPAQGSARWVDERSWVYDFAAPLPGGVRCRFDLVPGLETLAGGKVAGGPGFAFSTGGPAVLETNPWMGDAITDDQAFLLRLDAEPVDESVLRNVAFSVAGSPDAVGVRLLAASEREELLATLRPEERKQNWLALQARQRFPAGAKVTLQWGAGVATRSGVASTAPQSFPFTVRPPFQIRVQCGRERAKADCVPISPVRLVFSSPVAWSAASRVVLLREQPGQAPERVPAERAYAGEGDPFVERIRFRGPLAPNASYRIEIPDDLRDDAGRALAPPTAATRTLRTAAYPPLAKFPARFGILELKADPALPVTLRALEPEVTARLLGPAAGQTLPARSLRVAEPSGAQLLAWLRRLEAASDGTRLLPAKEPFVRRLALPLAPPPPGGDSTVIGIPLSAPGLHLVEIESKILGDRLLEPRQPMYVAAGALVTDLAVHFAWGRDASLVWVTTLEHGKPVPGARVAVVDCHGRARGEGITDAAGVLRLDGLPRDGALQRCEGKDRRWSAFDEGLLVTASRDGDLGFVHSSWTDGIEAWRFQVPTAWPGEPSTIGHTIFARTLLRAGETVHMKHVLRVPAMRGFTLPPADGLPNEVVLRHGGSGQEFVLPVAFGADATALSEWPVPTGGKLGVWQVSLRRGAPENGPEIATGSFRVEEFRLPYMRGTIRPPTEAQIGLGAVPVDVAVQYLSGGAASNLAVELRSELRMRERFPFEDEPGLGGFVFGRGAVQTGVRKGGLDVGCDGEDCAAPSDDGAPKIDTKKLTLDAAGTGRAEIPVETAGRPRELAVELAYRDPAGTVQTAAASVPIWPASRVVGLQLEGGWKKPEDVHAVALVLDLDGKPIAGAGVTLDAFEQRSYTHRRRLVGGFYAYSSVEETRPLRRFCEGKTDALGRLTCDGAIPISGNVLLEARSADAQGRVALTHGETWLSGDDPQWFEPSDGDRMDLLPDKRAYEPGETARFQVRMPFREATALVAVERSGVGEHFVVPLSGQDPTIEVPVTTADAPNVFVSVLVVRGRIGDVQPTAMVDLGRPAYRLGIAEIQVGWKADRLDVKVSPDRAVYRVREKARVAIDVAAANGAPLPPGAEVAISAVDEALLELLPNQSWDLLPAMMGRRSFGVKTATAQGLVIGKRHFGLKALPHGGGGGRRPTRELFDTLLLWQGRVALDGKGHAVVEVPLNDSLTSFRIAAIATAGAGLFGTGSATIRSTQDLMVLPGLPSLVREGDRFRARFTLRNTTGHGLDAALNAQVQGLATPLAPIQETLAAGAAREVFWEITVPPGVERLDWEVVVQSDGHESDRLHVAQRVAAAVPTRVIQGTVAALDPQLRLPVERPAGALPGRGGVDVAVRAKLSDGLAGVEDFLRGYPFGCLEQRTSRAVGLRDASRWQTLVAELPSYLDDDGLAKYFPSMREGSPVLTAYLLAISSEAGLALPEGPRRAMLDALVRFVEGKLSRRSVVPAPDLALRKLSALEALGRYDRAKPAMLGGVAIEPGLWPTSTLLDWIGVLRRTPGIAGGAEKLRQARALLRARLVLQGTTLSFTTQASDALTWLLATPDANAARAILESLESRVPAQEVARLVRGALGRQVRGSWDSTMADAWGVVALDRFSRQFEATPVSGAVELTLSGVTRRLAWDGAKEPRTRFEWPAAATELALRQAGAGRPWAMVQSLAAIPLQKPVSAGFTLTKTVTPLVQKKVGAYARGDVVKVTLEASAQSAQAWVVVRDPIPAGATLLGSGLGGGSLVADAATAELRCPCAAYTERSSEAFTQYYEWVPQGPFKLEYVMVLNQDGSFLLPPARVEAMYAPETFAELPNPPMVVGP